MKKLTPFLLLGLGLRLFLMSSTVHPDIRGHNLAAYLIAQKGQILDFYDYISRLPRTNPLVILYHDGLFIYPPLAYLTHAVFNFFLYPLYPQRPFDLLILDIGQAKGLPDFGLLTFLLKFPYLVADVFSLLILRKILDSKYHFLGSILWIFNPLTLYSAYMLSQFDIFIALFLLLALAYPKLSPIFIGLSAGFKPFPLFFLPFLSGSKLKNIATGLLTYLLSLLPYMRSVGFRQYALLANQTDKIVYAKIMVSSSQYLPLFFVAVIVLFWWHYFSPKSLSTWGWQLAFLLAFFSLTHFPPQWFTWTAPFLLLALINKPATRLPILVLLVSYALIIFSFEPSLNFGLLGLNYSLASILSDQNVSLIRAAFAATSLVVIAKSV